MVQAKELEAIYYKLLSVAESLDQTVAQDWL